MPLIRPATNLPDAARRLFAASPDPVKSAAGLLRLFEAGEIDPAGLFIATDGDSLRGAGLVQLLGGGQAGVWMPAADTDDIAVALIRHGLKWAKLHGAVTAQAGTEPGDPDGELFVLAGMTFTTHLVLMEILLPDHPTPLPDVPGLTLRHFSEFEPAEFAAALEESYVGTLDVPELNGTRPPADVLAGYRESSPSGDREWYLAERDGRAAGVLLLADGGQTWLLTYLGVVPLERGRRLGTALTRLALHRASSAKAQLLQLNSDERNFPAMHLYTSHGFTPADRRSVFLKQFRPGG